MTDGGASQRASSPEGHHRGSGLAPLAALLLGVIRLCRSNVSRRLPVARLFWGLFAALQLVLPGAAAWGDARLQAAARSDAAGHVEAHTSPQCAQVHAVDCIVCRFLSDTNPQPAAPAERCPAPAWNIAPRAHLHGQSDAGACFLARPRAPPVLLTA